MDRNVNITTDSKGGRIVLISNILFKGKRSVNWKEVKDYLEMYVGSVCEIYDTKDIINIGKDLPDFLSMAKTAGWNVIMRSMPLCWYGMISTESCIFMILWT